MVLNRGIIFLEIPSAEVVPSKHLKLKEYETDIDSVPLNGGVVVKNKAVSLDPYMKGRMRDPKVQSYAPAYTLGKPIDAFIIGEVVRSESDAFPVSSFIYGFSSVEEYSVIEGSRLETFKRIENKEGLPFSSLVGAAGMSGQTAWWSFYNIGKPKKGETIFVSAAAGAVGQIVVQLAKREGLKVVGSAGSDDKVAFLKELGADVAFNYKKENTLEILKSNPPNIYFDNVGGEVLDNVLETIQKFGRIIACGAVSQYNLPADQKYRLKNYVFIVGKELTYQGKSTHGFSSTEPLSLNSAPPAVLRLGVCLAVDDHLAIAEMSSVKQRRKAAPTGLEMPKESNSGSSSSVKGKGKGKARKDRADAEAHAAASSAVSSSRVPLLGHPISLDDGTQVDPQVHMLDDGRMQLSAPSTPWHEVDLSDSFLTALHNPPAPSPQRTFWQTRRLFFLLGGLIGIFCGWLFTEGDPLASLAGLDLDSFSTFDMHTLLSDLPSLSLNMNVSELLAPGREWLKATNTGFTVGREVHARGQKKEHSVIIIPGIVSSGLESWSTTPAAAPFFRKRIWASTAMLRAIVTQKDTWVAAMSLDEHTGLDPDGGREYKVRAAQGIDAASSFMPGYWIWQKVIENLAALEYDHNDLQLFSYDWRLSYFNLEVRDRYFSRLKYQIEFNLAVNNKKTVLVSHSMGGLVVLWFLKWVEAEGFGNGGPEWCEKHINDWVNIAGTLLGVPKAMSALLSGEMRDTVEINAAGVYLLERYFNRNERAKLFRSWAGAASMMLKGGNDVWGDEESAPDDKHNATLSGGNIFYFRPEIYSNTSEINERTVDPNLTMNDASTYVLEHVPTSYQRMIHMNHSFGFERDPEKIAENDVRHQAWANPLEVRLPKAPSMSIYCLYGTGKETERSYFYQQGGYERDEVTIPGNPVCEEDSCTNVTMRAPLDMPLSRRSWIDSSVTMVDTHEPKRPLYNPAGIKVVTHEIKHEPLAFDVRGGPTTADHVDILGSSELNEAVCDIATGHGGRVKDHFHSDIKKYAAKIKWEK
ncbi:phospholipid:diacylglycerol acyltransferase [Pseudohyphozyma bogoriensis]|nr:phospholipid:diacylglycerol acyltransferase [Pseudohyphozyma bogoriensis]